MSLECIYAGPWHSVADTNQRRDKNKTLHFFRSLRKPNHSDLREHKRWRHNVFFFFFFSGKTHRQGIFLTQETDETKVCSSEWNYTKRLRHEGYARTSSFSGLYDTQDASLFKSFVRIGLRNLDRVPQINDCRTVPGSRYRTRTFVNHRP